MNGIKQSFVDTRRFVLTQSNSSHAAYHHLCRTAASSSSGLQVLQFPTLARWSPPSDQGVGPSTWLLHRLLVSPSRAFVLHSHASVTVEQVGIVPKFYAKYELAYPCGNDANTGRCCRYNSILSLEKKIVSRPPPGTKVATPEIRIRKFIFCVERVLFRKGPVSVPQTLTVGWYVPSCSMSSLGWYMYVPSGTQKKLTEKSGCGESPIAGKNLGLSWKTFDVGASSQRSMQELCMPPSKQHMTNAVNWCMESPARDSMMLTVMAASSLQHQTCKTCETADADSVPYWSKYDCGDARPNMTCDSDAALKTWLSKDLCEADSEANVAKVPIDTTTTPAQLDGHLLIAFIILVLVIVVALIVTIA